MKKTPCLKGYIIFNTWDMFIFLVANCKVVNDYFEGTFGPFGIPLVIGRGCNPLVPHATCAPAVRVHSVTPGTVVFLPHIPFNCPSVFQ